ncbi:UNVERIFIED_CONTAM: hypothetical protein Sradi_5992700 [Sesamum radiatum]|uniref:Uncharacterized protein n=1 Tax=Sesamum radiatum TaxID=300843 RepID=A0AAW2KHK6_SESRA
MKLGHSLLISNTPPPHRILSRHTATSYVALSAEPLTERVKLAESLQAETLKILEWPAYAASSPPSPPPLWASERLNPQVFPWDKAQAKAGVSSPRPPPPWQSLSHWIFRESKTSRVLLTRPLPVKCSR